MELHDLEMKMKEVIGSVRKGDADAFISEHFSVDFDMDRLKSVDNSSQTAIGLRILEDGYVGNSVINDMSKTAELIANAKQSAKFGDKIEIELPEMTQIPELKLFDPEVLKYTKQQAIELGEKTVKRLKEIDADAKIGVSVSAGKHTSVLLNTSGFHGVFEETSVGFYASMMLVDDEGGILEVGESDSSNRMHLDTQRVYELIEWRYKNALKKTSIKTGYFPIVFAPDATGLFLNSICPAANGKNLHRGVSVFAGKEGERVADTKLTIYDDPFYDDGERTYPFDDEGVVPKRMAIIENGVFCNYIFDLTIAGKMNRESTGHGSRSPSTLPQPSFSNLVFQTGDADFEAMIRSIPYGLYVVNMLGEGMSNVISGDFSVNVELGYLIVNGKVKGRVKDAMISGNAFEMIKSIKAIENKLTKQGNVMAPHILIENVSVAG